MALAGTISPHLGNLSLLTSLNLSLNYFNGSLPKQLSYLHRLVYVSLAYNQFANEIPTWLDNFHKLQYLNFANNSFTGHIPKQIANLSQLNVLVLRGNQLQGSIPSTNFNMSSLSKLDLSFNYISGSLPVDLCNHLPLLWYLSVSANQLEGELPSKYLFKCTQFRILSLSVNKFQGSLPREIGNLTMLEEVYIGENNFSGCIWKCVCPATSTNICSSSCCYLWCLSVQESKIKKLLNEEKQMRLKLVIVDDGGTDGIRIRIPGHKLLSNRMVPQKSTFSSWPQVQFSLLAVSCSNADSSYLEA